MELGLEQALLGLVLELELGLGLRLGWGLGLRRAIWKGFIKVMMDSH